MVELAINGGDPVLDYSLPTVEDISGRDIGDEEMALVSEVIRSGNLGYLHGTKLRQFQDEWRKKFNVSTAVAVSSGTAALHTAMIFLGIGPGDEVLVPAITDMGTVIAVLLQNAVPVFVDVKARTQNMDPDKMEKMISKNTKAVIPVHLYGFPCDMDPIMEIAEKHGLFVVEDCCQAHLAGYKGRLVGTIGDLGCFSFQQSKHMTTGDGGMVITNRDNLCGRKLIHCADKGWPREQYREHLFLAPNYHMTDLQAAVGIAQFRKLEGFIEKRRRNAILLSSLINDIPGVFPPPEIPGMRHTYYEYALDIEPELYSENTEKIAGALCSEGVKTAPGYLPKPIYMYEMIGKPPEICPVALKACSSMLYIPWNEKLTEKNVFDIAKAIRKVLTYYLK